MSRRSHRWFPTAVALLAAAGCAPAARPAAIRYTPRTRELTVTTVPLLVKESRTAYPFLAADFARGGVLEGKEVYAFSPSTLTVVEGDTVHFTFINPEDDEHWFFLPDCSGEKGESFVLPDCAVRLPPQRATRATYIARHAGIYPFMCIVVKHVPMMQGQLLVLSPAAVEGAGRSGPGE
jgi:plastocyanin